MKKRRAILLLRIKSNGENMSVRSMGYNSLSAREIAIAMKELEIALIEKKFGKSKTDEGDGR